MHPIVAGLIVAAGRGERAGQHADGPKQYRKLAGVSVLRRSIDALASLDPLAVIIHADDRALFEDAVAGLDRELVVVIGGATRQASVEAGLAALAGSAPDIVLIHDGVRPFVDGALIDRVVVSVAATGDGAIPAVPLADTLKRRGADGTVDGTVDRETLVAAQTPQGFPYRALALAHEAAMVGGEAAFTDDASIYEWAGHTVRLVEGSVANIKLTFARDLEAAAEHLGGRRGMIDVRTGNGYDVHQLVAGDGVTLCGIRIGHDRSLAGHSDADVGLHALTDALLATCGAGDIGDHFPPSDPQWKGAASHRFVRHAAALVADRGGRIANADVTLICEAPKIAPHRQAMREAMAQMLGIDLDRVSVKATTNETIGFVGRREGIAAIATASVVYGDPS